MEPTASLRVDKWLWAARLFKTRSLATQACNAGKIKRANLSLKASALIRPGDHLDIPSADGCFKRHIEVLEILDTRVSAPIAMAAYRDHTSVDVIAEAQKKRTELHQQRLLRKEGDQGRMSKKQRRDWRKGLHSYKQQDDDSDPA